MSCVGRVSRNISHLGLNLRGRVPPLDRKVGGVTIPFQDRGGLLFGVSEDGREWRITHTDVGWRLEFLEPVSERPRFVGIYRSLAGAMLATESD